MHSLFKAVAVSTQAEPEHNLNNQQLAIQLHFLDAPRRNPYIMSIRRVHGCNGLMRQRLGRFGSAGIIQGVWADLPEDFVNDRINNVYRAKYCCGLYLDIDGICARAAAARITPRQGCCMGTDC